jgi:hypothetical protein
MEQQKEIAYQLNLFTEQEQEAVSFAGKQRSVSSELDRQGLQMSKASSQERALAYDHLMGVICSSGNILRAYKQVKRNQGTLNLPNGVVILNL